MPRTSSAPSRRTLLLGGAGALTLGTAGLLAGVGSGLLPGRVRLDRALGRGEVQVGAPSGPFGDVAYSTFASQARGGPVTWGLSVPPGLSARGLPVVLALHGRGGDAHAAFDLLAMHRFVAAHVRSGGAPLAVVSIDGGADTYWHPRVNGEDPLAMITDELVPRLATWGCAPGRSRSPGGRWAGTARC